MTPQTAHAWLATSTQRRLVRSVVDDLVDAMRSGRWDPDIHYDSAVSMTPRSLCTGHHRLHAVAEFGQPVHMWVIGELHDA